MSFPPLRFNTETAFSSGDLTILSWVEIRGTFTRYSKVKKGLFGLGVDYKFVPEDIGVFFIANPIRGGVWRTHLDSSLAKYPYPVLGLNDQLDNRIDEMDFTSFYLNDIGQWETVNGHQWEGIQPITRTNDKGLKLEDETAMWDIATVAGTERVLAYRGHNPRDEVFSLNMHLNNFFDYWRNLVEPIQTDIDEYEAMTTNDTVSDDEKRSARGAIYNLVLDQYRETKPPWDNG